MNAIGKLLSCPNKMPIFFITKWFDRECSIVQYEISGLYCFQNNNAFWCLGDLQLKIDITQLMLQVNPIHKKEMHLSTKAQTLFLAVC
jgi:hypothetical protein